MNLCSYQDCTVKVEARGWCRTHYTRWKRHGDPSMIKNLPKGSEPYDSILKHGVALWGDCHIYLGETNGASGYGMTYGKLLAHRVSYEKHYGPIPDNMWVDHVCHNEAAARGTCDGGGGCLHRRCVNPDHLKVKTPRENSIDSPLAGGKTHCKHGHEYTVENTYVQPQSRGYGTGRVCRTCRRLRANSYSRLGTGWIW